MTFARFECGLVCEPEGLVWSSRCNSQTPEAGPTVLLDPPFSYWASFRCKLVPPNDEWVRLSGDVIPRAQQMGRMRVILTEPSGDDHYRFRVYVVDERTWSGTNCSNAWPPGPIEAVRPADVDLRAMSKQLEDELRAKRFDSEGGILG